MPLSIYSSPFTHSSISSAPSFCAQRSKLRERNKSLLRLKAYQGVRAHAVWADGTLFHTLKYRKHAVRAMAFVGQIDQVVVDCYAPLLIKSVSRSNLSRTRLYPEQFTSHRSNRAEESKPRLDLKLHGRKFQMHHPEHKPRREAYLSMRTWVGGSSR